MSFIVAGVHAYNVQMHCLMQCSS